jgi:hypothetical protein
MSLQNIRNPTKYTLIEANKNTSDISNNNGCSNVNVIVQNSKWTELIVGEQK